MSARPSCSARRRSWGVEEGQEGGEHRVGRVAIVAGEQGEGQAGTQAVVEGEQRELAGMGQHHLGAGIRVVAPGDVGQMAGGVAQAAVGVALVGEQGGRSSGPGQRRSRDRG